MNRRVRRLVFAATLVASTVLVGMQAPASAASGWTSVSAGAQHTCGIRGGRVYCWGFDEFGQLGDGTAGGSRATPAPIRSRATDWTSVTAGGSQTCATRAGRVACWGSDSHGQLGDGTAGGSRATPALIASSATDWTSVRAGGLHTCATRAGRVACWGNDQYGQLGDGAVTDSPDPTPGLIASGATDWTSVSAGGFHTCGTRAGRIACWGLDAKGQLGDGTANDTDPTPGFIRSRATDWTKVTAGGQHTCAIRIGRIACWGNDEKGQLGDGTAGIAADPTPGLVSSAATDWTSVSTGGNHTCATRAGRIACWGNDEKGQLGDGTANDAADPTPGLIYSRANDWKSVSSGSSHTCAIRTVLLACWGNDHTGQLGDGADGDTPDPFPSPVS